MSIALLARLTRVGSGPGSFPDRPRPPAGKGPRFSAPASPAPRVIQLASRTRFAPGGAQRRWSSFRPARFRYVAPDVPSARRLMTMMSDERSDSFGRSMSCKTVRSRFPNILMAELTIARRRGARWRCLWPSPKARKGLLVARAFRQHFFPQGARPRQNPTLRGQHRQVAPGHVAEDAVIDTAKPVGPFQIQNPPPTLLGCRRFASSPPSRAATREARLWPFREGQFDRPHETPKKISRKAAKPQTKTPMPVRRDFVSRRARRSATE